MKKISLIDNIEHLSEQAKRDLFEIEKLLNSSYENLKETALNLNDIEKSFEKISPTRLPKFIIH